jgi:hypothetical protein
MKRLGVTLANDFVLKFLCFIAMAVWLGGFTFYSAFVIPVLHDHLPSARAGAITQQVTNRLNAIGVASLALAWLDLCIAPTAARTRTREMLLWLLAGSTTILLSLFILHRVMDLRLETRGLDGFYPFHRAYLIASTVQWFVNMAIIFTWMLCWTARQEDAHTGLAA